jgi:hypothetical protein
VSCICGDSGSVSGSGWVVVVPLEWGGGGGSNGGRFKVWRWILSELWSIK